jgi:predicted deacylase
MVSFFKDYEVEIVKDLKVHDAPKGTITRYFVQLVKDGMGMPTFVPVLIARGKKDGPVLGLTAAVHGNELNGIPIIQELFKEIDFDNLRGTLVGVPVVNVPSLLLKKRRFTDNTDLNHVFPGVQNGNTSQVYAYRIVDRIINKLDYLLDLHTASFGRINSFYIRADMSDPETAKLAELQNAQIIVHNTARDGTLRGAAGELGIKAITLEVGDPNRFQKTMIQQGQTGVQNVMYYLDMLPGKVIPAEKKAILCKESYWLYTNTGGILHVPPTLTEVVQKDQVIASMRNIFGDLITDYKAPQEGIVIGKSINPINQTGGRILHLGIFDQA